MSFFGSLFARNIPTSSNQVGGLPNLSGNGLDVMFKAIFSNTWETIDQTYYTKLAQTIDPIDSTITFYSEILASGIIKSRDKAGNDTSDDNLLVQLLRNPNENQNQGEFIKEWLYYFYAHGYTYILPQSSSVGFEYRLDGKTKTQLYNLDPDNYVWKTFLNSLLNFVGIRNKDSISFEYSPLGLPNVSYKNVIAFFDVRQNPLKPWMGISRLLSLKPNIENYSLALQAKKNMIKRSGSQIVSFDKTNDDYAMDTEIGTGELDKDGVMITITHKRKLEQQLRDTGIGNESMGVAFSTIPLKTMSLSAGLEKIKYDDLGIQDARVIMNKFNLPSEFQNLTLDRSKYANRDAAMMEVVQNTCEPLGNTYCKKMQMAFNEQDEIYMDFSHLPVYSDDIETRTDQQQAIVNLYEGLLANNRIDENTFNEKLKEHGIIN